jgi:uncharacterized protein
MIQRHLSDHLLRVAKSFPAILLTGARQVGKTTVLKETFPDAAFSTLDLPSVAYEAENNGLAFLNSFPGGAPVILDEVQYAPDLFRMLKFAVDADRHRMGRFLMTGSQKFTLMQSVSESLAGRVAIIEMDTLSALELRDHCAMNGKTMPSLEEFLWRGGYPELWRKEDISPRLFYASYLATYLERDVRQLINVTSLRDFERFIRMCALRSGSLINLDSLGSDVGISSSTAKQWLGVLEASNIIQLLQPYSGNLGKRMIKTPKLYFKDTGLACFLLNISSPEALLQSPFLGGIWETFVLGQMMRAAVVEDSAAQVYFWKDAHGTEVDFVIANNGYLHLVETKWSENGGDSSHLKPMHKVRKDMAGKMDGGTHLLICRTPTDHWHPHDPSVRVVNGYAFCDWFRLPVPPVRLAREDGSAYTVRKATKKAKKTARKRTSSSKK